MIASDIKTDKHNDYHPSFLPRWHSNMKEADALTIVREV